MQNAFATCSIQVMLAAAAGMHMRPAAMLVKIARKFDSEVTLEHNCENANAKSLLGVIMLGLRAGAEFTVFANGRDAPKAIRAIKEYFSRLFLEQTAVVLTSEDSHTREIAVHDMKETKMEPKEKNTLKKTQNFIWLHNSDAEAVYLAGDFNNWIPTAMARLDGCFQALVDLYPGEHQYKFVVDGQWRNDPAETDSAPNVFGTTNSVVRVN